MGYNTNRLDLTLADVVGDTPDTLDMILADDDEFWLYDYGYDDYDEPDPEFDYDLHEVDYEDDPPIVIEDLGHDPYEHLPFTGKISPAACLGKRVLRPTCRCCGAIYGIRRGRTRRPRFNVKPKRKDHRS